MYRTAWTTNLRLSNSNPKTRQSAFTWIYCTRWQWMAVLHAKHSNLVFLISLGQHLYTGKSNVTIHGWSTEGWWALERNEHDCRKAALLQFIFFFSLPNWNPWTSGTCVRPKCSFKLNQMPDACECRQWRRFWSSAISTQQLTLY